MSCAKISRAAIIIQHGRPSSVKQSISRLVINSLALTVSSRCVRYHNATTYMTNTHTHTCNYVNCGAELCLLAFVVKCELFAFFFVLVGFFLYFIRIRAT